MMRKEGLHGRWLALVAAIVVAVFGWPQTPVAQANGALPPGWSEAITDSALVTSGGGSYSNGVFTLSAKGGKLQSSGDSAYFMSTPVEGDFTMTARLVSWSYPAGASSFSTSNSIAMLMVKDGTEKQSLSYSVWFQPAAASTAAQGMTKTYKRFSAASGGSARSDSTVLSLPVYLKLQRTGSVYAGYYSTDGITYTKIGGADTTGGMTTLSPMQVGLAVSEASNVTFDQVAIVKADGTVVFDSTDTGTPPGEPSDHPTVALSGPISSVAPGESFILKYGLSHVTSSVYEAVYTQKLTFEYDPSAISFVDARPVRSELSLTQVDAGTPGRLVLTAQSQGHGSGNTADGPMLEMIWLAANPAVKNTTEVKAVQALLTERSGQQIAASGGSYTVSIASQVSKTALQSAYAAAQTLYDGAIEGTMTGQYEPGSKQALLPVLQAAAAVLELQIPEQAQLDLALANLQQAVQLFNSRLLAPVPGDVDGNRVVDLGDLGLAAVSVGLHAGSPQWDAVKAADANQDGMVDAKDLELVSSLIP
ncbi:dockerin type I domain-containing protein [Paenibacillus puerhi]|uniref:dockerin type I domain-containing protein n=1 Tax=Paenibacillus puerhi TaxID=2692622 RepID=UPI001356EF50|nr:dockerin type I domain-containing protein [Paenibacillus puerhi]